MNKIIDFAPFYSVSGEYVPPDEPTGSIEIPQNMLTFISNGSTTVTLSSIGSPDPIEMQYSINGQALQTYNLNEVISLSDGDYVSFYGQNDHFSKDGSNYYRFQMTGTGTIASSGNIQSLMDYSDSVTSSCYVNLFSGCTSLATAPDLPAVNLAYASYNSMFMGCTNLITAPQLPAIIVANNCYQGMFQNCTKLTTPPSLPATTISEGSYSHMFDGCTSLKSVPDLPASSVPYGWCYNYMFKGCTSLKSVPKDLLPMTTLRQGCYLSMFEGCTSLSSAPILPATTLANNCYYNMFCGCTSLSTAPQLPATTLANSCYAVMFAGCRSLTSTPVLLPANVLTPSCYYQMFAGCTNITDGPTILALSTSTDSCDGMFSGCSKLSSIGVDFDTWTEGATDNWVNGVAANGIFEKPVELANTEGVNNIPNGWTVKENATIDQNYFTIKSNGQTAVKIQAVGSPYSNTFYYNKNGQGWQAYTINTNIMLLDEQFVSFSGTASNFSKSSSNNYYKIVIDGTGNVEAIGDIKSLVNNSNTATAGMFASMFSGCVKLIDAEDLKLMNTTANNCYENMFAYCSNLTDPPQFPTTGVAAPSCYHFMFDRCIMLKTPPVLKHNEYQNGAAWGIFRNCSSLTSVPVLSATTLSNNCYRGMFEGCVKITDAPYLPATTVPPSGYRFMFYGCSLLTSIAVNFTSWNAANTSDWVNGVATNGTFYKPNELASTKSQHNIPNGWLTDDINNYNPPSQVVTTTDPLTFTATGNVSICLSGVGVNLHALDIELDYNNSGDWHDYTVNTWITLTDGQTVKVRNGYNFFNKDNSNYYKFITSGDGTLALNGNINSLINGKDRVSDEYVFAHLFENCDNITDASELALTITNPTKGCYWSLFDGCDRLANSPENRIAKTSDYMFYSAFRNCDSLTHVITINSKKLHEGCYFNMFEGCDDLTRSPNLPATELTKCCYYNMFKDCNNLEYINAQLLVWQPENATTNWVKNVAEEGMFIGKEGLDEVYGDNNVPINWDIEYSQWDIDPDLLTFVSQGNTSVKLVKSYGNAPNVSFYYSKNGEQLQPYTLDTAIVLEDDQIVSFSGTSNVISNNNDYRGHYSFITEGVGNLILIGKLGALNNSSNEIHNYQYQYMFSGCTNIVDISQLQFIEDTPLARNCYFGTFEGTSLTAVPDNFDFLKNIPTSAIACCRAMFFNCKTIQVVPSVLPATTLSKECYYHMFLGCTNLTQAPFLPVIDVPLDLSCYYQMFYGCTNLNAMNVNFTWWCENNYFTQSKINTQDWVTNVQTNNSCIFYKPTELEEIHGNSTIPSNWTAKDKDWLGFKSTGVTKVKLVAVGSPVEADIQYSFNGSYLSSYSIGKEFELRDGEWIQFTNKDDYFSTNSSNYYKFVIEGTGTVELTGKLQSLINYSNDVPNYAFYHLFENCTKITDAQNSELRVSTIGTNSCEGLFKGCTNLTDSPKYYNPTLSTEAFKQMFYGCSRLSSIDVKFVDWTPSNATTNWVSGVATLGIFIKDGMLPKQIGFNYIPVTWIDEDTVPLTFKSHGITSVGIDLRDGSLDPIDVVYRKNKGGLGIYTVGDWIDLSDGDILMFRNRRNTPVAKESYTWSQGLNSISAKYSFKTSGDGTLDVYGDVQSFNDFEQNKTFQYMDLFYNCQNIVDASELVLTTITDPKAGLFRSLFYNCTSLTSAPQLLSFDTVQHQLYTYMFANCSSLIIPPSSLPATRWNNNCYYRMFINCYAMTGCPAFPTAVIDVNGGRGTMAQMFQRCRSIKDGPVKKFTYKNPQNALFKSLFFGCHSLTGAMELSAANGDYGIWNGYGNMYQYCTGLVIPPKWNNTFASDYMWGMFKDCWSLTAIPDFSSINRNGNNFDHMFQNCISLTSVPADCLPTGNTIYCEAMFKGCRNLQNAPDLPATSARANMYKQMFAGCPKISAVNLGLSSWTTQDDKLATQDWLSDVAPSGTITFTTTQLEDIRDNSHIPIGWNGGTPITIPENAITFICKRGTSKIRINKTNTPGEVDIWYSRNNGAAQQYSSLNTALTMVEGDQIKFWNNTNNWSSSNGYYRFNDADSDSDSQIWVSGDIRSLINFSDTLVAQNFVNLFNADNRNITNASGLILPSSIASNCYQEAFRGCTKLTAIPYFPAIDLADNCYKHTFLYCSSIVTPMTSLPATGLADSCYYGMFYGCTSLTTVPSLPATTMTNNCYMYMFSGCTSLTSVPSGLLSATTLAENCYDSMFKSCTSLTSTPALPATELQHRSYQNMFYGCTSLTHAYDLPGLSGGKDTYLLMFGNCSALTDAPRISLTGTYQGSCYRMFENCTSLTSITLDYNKTSWPGSTFGDNDNSGGWVKNVSPTGIFHKTFQLPVERGTHRIPSGWAVDVMNLEIPTNAFTIISHGDTKVRMLGTAPTASVSLHYTINNEMSQLPFNSNYIDLADGDQLRIANMMEHLNDVGSVWIDISGGTATVSGDIRSLIGWNDTMPTGAFRGLFTNCSKLVNASQLTLPLSTTESCYQNMFMGCTGLTSIPNLMATDLAPSCYAYMFYNCNSLQNVPAYLLPASSLGDACCMSMFGHCSSLTNAVILSATTLAPSCYCGMFENTAIATAPQLNATTLAPACYQYMFCNCINLTTVPQLPAETLYPYCYAGMFDGCSSLVELTVNFTDWASNVNATTNWLRNVGTPGNLYAPNTLPIKIGASFIPNGWNGYEATLNGDQFAIVSKDASTHKVSITTTGTPYNNNLQYTFDGIIWEDYSINTVIDFNDIIYFRGTTNQLNKSLTDFYHFNITGAVDLTGNIDYLIDNSSMNTSHVFANLFANNATSIIDVSQLVLPSTGLTTACYHQMFSGCTSLTAGPELPATTVPVSGYQSMFEKCSGMVTGPTNLPATTISQESYRAMFSDCKSLTSWVYISATSIPNRSLRYMFYNCFKIDHIEVAFTDWTNDNNNTSNWVAAVATNGTFVKPAALPPSTGVNYIPARWVIEDAGSVVREPLTFTAKSASNLSLDKVGSDTSKLTANIKYNKNNSNWTDYTAGDVINLATNDTVMFSGVANTFSWNENQYYQFKMTGTIEASGNLMALENYRSYITNSKDFVYLFKNCSGLLTAPSLPATTLSNNCYKEMFYGCSNLSSIEVSFTDWDQATDMTLNWVSGVAAEGNFIKPEELEVIYDNSRIPEGWKVNGEYVNPDVPDIPEDGPLTFVGKSLNNAIQLHKFGQPTGTFNFQYSKNGGQWTTYNVEDIIELSKNDTVAFSGANEVLSQASGKSFHFNMTGSIEAYGNIQSLLNFSTVAPQACYYSMFSGCTQLIKAPQIMATTVNTDSYNKMFSGCTNLITPPIELPATTLAQSSYKTMFGYCNSLTGAPNISATAFTGKQAMQYMFDYCSSLSSIEVALTSWPGNSNIDNWCRGVQTTAGTFTCPTALGTNSSITRGASNCPNNWTVVNN